MSTKDLIAQRTLLISMLLGIMIAALASQKPPRIAQNADTIAVVNGELVSQVTADSNQDNFISDAELQHAIDQRLILQEAARTELLADDTIAQQAVETRLLVRQAHLFSLLPVTDEDLQSYYDLNKDKFSAAKAVHVELLYLTLAAAQEITPSDETDETSTLDRVRTALKGGMEFSAAQEQYGQTASFTLPRRLTSVERLRDLMPLGLFQVAMQLQEGTITDAFRFGDGWYFINIAERENLPAPRYEDVMGQVRSLLEQKALRETRARLVAHLRESATITNTRN